MTIASFLDQRIDLRQLLWRGVAIGVAGGLAEIAVVGGYSRVAGVNAFDIAAAVATAAHLDAGSPTAGLLVHMGLAALLGIGLMTAGAMVGLFRARNVRSLYTTMFLSLGAVWAVNFLLVLPWLSPAFLTVLPLPIALLSKLCFGAVAGALLHWVVRAQDERSGRRAVTALSPG